MSWPIYCFSLFQINVWETAHNVNWFLLLNIFFNDWFNSNTMWHSSFTKNNQSDWTALFWAKTHILTRRNTKTSCTEQDQTQTQNFLFGFFWHLLLHPMKMVSIQKSYFEDDLSGRRPYNIKSRISQQPLVRSYPNFKLKLMDPNLSVNEDEPNGRQPIKY
jgi:hypothetical protein